MSLKLTAVSLLLASVTFAAAPPPATVVKEVTGEAAIVDGNRDKAFAEAKSAALRDAVEQVAGVLVSADTLTANSQLISDRILMHSAGYVRTHEVLERMRVLALTCFPEQRGPLESFFDEARGLLEAHQRGETQDKPLAALGVTLNRLEDLLEVFILLSPLR